MDLKEEDILGADIGRHWYYRSKAAALRRMVLPLAYGEYQSERFDRVRGQCELIYRGGRFYIYATVDMPEDSPIGVTDFLGVDLGIVNLAADSDGTRHGGEAVEGSRSGDEIAAAGARLDQVHGRPGPQAALQRYPQRPEGVVDP